jgi:hypothetical protein
METDLENKLVVIKPEKLSPEYRSIDHQLAICTGGFGSKPNARGRTVFCTNLYTSKNSQWQRNDIAGTFPEERLPDWARLKLAALREPSEKEAPTVPPMGKEQFWQIIDDARNKSGGKDAMLETIVKSLTKLDEPDIIRGKQIFNEYQDHAYKNKLWAAATIINNGCSDDGFLDFRSWLISQGKEVYLNALAAPDSLANVQAIQDFGAKVQRMGTDYSNYYDDFASFESIAYAAGDAYKAKLGEDAEIYDVLNNPLLTDLEFADIEADIVFAADIHEEWSGRHLPIGETEENMQRMCPKLYAAFREVTVLEASAAVKSVTKESVLEKIKQDRQGKAEKPPNQDKQKNNKKNKSDPEL